MKKLSVLIALALLAVAGTGYAAFCSYDNVPGATLLVPYWRVSLNGATGAPIPTGGVDTLVSMVNVSTPGLIAHVTVWNKYSRAVLDFNVPMTGKDVVSFSMRDIMNGKLNVNFTQVQNFLGSGTGDPCGVNLSVSPAVYLPKVGFGAKQFIRFSHPEAGATNSDAYTSVSVYAADAFAAFRNRVWDSLDESGDITSFQSSARRQHSRLRQPGLRRRRQQRRRHVQDGPFGLPDDRRRELLHELLPRERALLQRGRHRDDRLVAASRM